MTDAVHELPTLDFQTIQCRNTGTLTIETADIEHHDEQAPVQLSSEGGRSGVHVSIGKAMPNDGTDASTTVYLSPSGAEDLADALRNGTPMQVTKDYATIWLRMGWLYHDGLGRHSDRATGQLEYSGSGSLSVTVSDDETNSRMSAAALLDDDEREWLADVLESEADTARNYEPIKTDDTDADEPSPRIPAKWKRAATTLGVTGVAGYIGLRVMNAVAGSVMINGEPMPPLGIVEVTPLVLALLLIVGLIHMLFGGYMPGAGGRQ